MITHRTRAAVPVDCLSLQEDIMTLSHCWELLRRVDADNVHEDREEGLKQLRMASAIIKTCHRIAWDKMRQEYLAPRRKKITHENRKRGR